MYVFIKLADQGNTLHKTKVSFELEDDPSVEQLLIEFRAFLLACGHDIKGEIMVQPEEDSSPVDV